MELGAIDPRRQKITEIIKEVANVPTVYGKCRASYIGKDNKSHTMDNGTMSVQECDVTDYDGYKVFKKVQED